mgnify:CR=1 FL=1
MIDWQSIIFGLMGGLGIFLYGMHIMSDSLQRVAGDRMKSIMAFLTKNRFMGVGVGALVTAVIQSSSATTVMTVGFVNAGIMTFSQAISVVMGANIGTTITAQIIAFKITHYAPPMIGVGVALALFAKNKRWNLYGGAILGLGFLFFGLYLMSKGLGPLKQHEAVKEFFHHFSTNPFSALLAGVLMTCILQSSSATIALAIVLGQQGLIDLSAAIPMILGDNIGTTITAQIAALNTSRAARRTAMSHTLFNLIGAAIFLPLAMTGVFQKIIVAFTPGSPEDVTRIGRFIANSHTFFNVINTALFMGLIVFLKKASIWIIPIHEDENKERPHLLEPHLLDSPPIALELVRKELIHMINVSQRAANLGIRSIMNDDIKAAKKTHKLEDTTDDFQQAITQYLVSLSERDLSTLESEQLPTLMHSVNDIERVGDLAENLAEIGEGMQESKIHFSQEASRNLEELTELVQKMFQELIKAVDGDNEAALEVLALEKEVNKMRNRLDNEHVERLKAGTCLLPSASFFLDALHNLERMGDHLKNVAQTAYHMFTYSKGKARLKKIRKQQALEEKKSDSENPSSQ